VDPGVELLGDAPIATAAQDLLGRAPVAERLVELATSAPVFVSRAVALLGEAGSGKTSALALMLELLRPRADVAVVDIDAAAQPTAVQVATVVTDELAKLFASEGVLGATDKARNALASYASVVGSIVKAAVKVDVSDALRRSPKSLRAEISESTRDLGKRIVVAIDHLDRLPLAELEAALAALSLFAELPFVSVVLTLEPRTRAHLPLAFARLVATELSLPPPDRVLLARVIAGGLAHYAARTGTSVDAILPLFDFAPEGAGLALISTPRDAKRVVNALSAVLPLVPAERLAGEALAVTLLTVEPSLDPVALARRASLDEEERVSVYRALCPPLAGMRAVAIARALRQLVVESG
jgi:hypothetical protein